MCNALKNTLRFLHIGRVKGGEYLNVLEYVEVWLTHIIGINAQHSGADVFSKFLRVDP